jgi:hypothetical protein
MPVFRLSNHRTADVHPNNPTTRANQRCEIPHVISRPTPDIEQTQTVVQFKLCEHHLLHLLDVLEGIASVEEGDEEARISLLINGGESRDIACVFHGMPLIDLESEIRPREIVQMASDNVRTYRRYWMGVQIVEQ